jgi:hypothetical protein
MTEERFLKRLRKNARKGLRGWPIATIALYGPNLRHVTLFASGDSETSAKMVRSCDFALRLNPS